MASPPIRLRYLLMRIDPTSRTAIPSRRGRVRDSRIDLSVRQELSLCLLFDSRCRLRSSAKALARAHERLRAAQKRLELAFAP
jgi:hypothetical protein